MRRGRLPMMGGRLRFFCAVFLCCLGGNSKRCLRGEEGGKRYAENMSSNTMSSSHLSPAPDRTTRSVKSIGSRGSILSIGSVNSFCSIGSVNSAFSIGSVFSIGSIGSVFSAGAVASCLGLLGVLSVFSGLSVLSTGSYRSALKVNRRPGTRPSGPSRS